MSASAATAMAATTPSSLTSSISGTIRRWSLAQLAALEPTAVTAQTMLEEVIGRLEVQAMTCDTLLQQSEALLSTSSSTTTKQLYSIPQTGTPIRSQQNNNTSNKLDLVRRQLNFLRHVHIDTLQQCRQVADRRNDVWPRWSYADQRMVRQCLEQVRDRHAPSLERWVDVAMALRQQHPHNDLTYDDDDDDDDDIRHHDQTMECYALLDQLLQGRLSIQFLTHHVALITHEDLVKRRPTGAIAVQSPLSEFVHEAFTEAHFLCDAHYQCSPDLDDTNLPSDLRVTVVRPWMGHCLTELCKNGMCATVQRYHPVSSGDDDDIQQSQDPPPLVVAAQLTETNDNDNNSNNDNQTSIVLTIQDHGIGLPSSVQKQNNLFGWGTSSSAERWDRINEQQTYAAVRPPLASLGVGLPSSRAMMRQFGGNLELLSSTTSPNEEGGGCTARITIPQNIDLLERLPPHFEEWEESKS